MSSQQESVTPPPVLIVGAGPTGLLTSLWLTKYGVPHRIVDRHTTPGQTSRAIVVHARTLEYYRMLGLDQELLGVAAKVKQVIVNNGGRKRGEVHIGDAGLGQSYFPFITSVTQDEHEEILQQRIEAASQKVERGIELVKMDLPPEDDAQRYVDVTIRPVGRSGVEDETITASYVIGCDGAHSTVRHATRIAMEGGTYEHTFFVADVLCHGSMQTEGNLNICTSSNEFVIVLPLPHKGNRARVIGIVPDELQHLSTDEITFEDCLPTIKKAAPGLEVDDVRWFAHYQVHHRCAASFQYGHRVFLCGDAAHLHSPVGGQGMNTGLGDASNLAWKIATAWHATGKVPRSLESVTSTDELLSTYNTERKRFADHLVSSNDRLFQFIIQRNVFGWVLRNVIVPYIAPLLFNFFKIRAYMYQRVSQIDIEYGPSTLSQSNTSRGIQGYRLPWIERPNGAAGKDDNHSLLDGSGWQAHVFGAISAPEQNILRGTDVPVYQFPWSSEAQKKGFKENTVYLVRPDGYIGLVLEKDADSENVIKQYIQRWSVGSLR